MLYLIDPDNYHLHKNDLNEMYQLRHRVFFEQMKWHVSSENGMEKDEYDEQDMYYLIYKDDQGIVRGCVRFIEMTHTCMFDGPFTGHAEESPKVLVLMQKGLLFLKISIFSNNETIQSLIKYIKS